MAARDYWSHNTPDGKTPWAFITKTGYHYQKAGENLAYGFSNAEDTITGWMNSTEHRANILNASYSEVGFGVVDVPNYNHSGPETLVVAMYARPATASTAAANVDSPFEQKAPVTSEPAAQHVARVQLLAGGTASWSLFAVSTIAGAAMLLFILRHGLLWRRVIVKSETFVLHHPLLDVAVVVVATIGVILSKTAGVIQ
jgi:hypothetical protein